MKTAVLGSKAIGVAALRALHELSDVTAVLTLDDRKDRRSRLDELQSFGARVVTSKTEADAHIRSIDAELFVVAGWYWHIDGVEKRRFVGVHHSMLPRYRGGSPLVWALLSGDTVVGTSLFTLTEGMDEGPIWAQAPVPVGDGYIGDVARRCDEAAVGLLAALFSRREPQEQEHGRASWCAQRSPGDGEIDWTLPAHQVERFIRAQSAPYPGAFTYCGEEKVTIWRASASPMRYVGTPGQVVSGMVVCGDARPLIVEEADRPLRGRIGPQVLRYGRVA